MKHGNVLYFHEFDINYSELSLQKKWLNFFPAFFGLTRVQYYILFFQINISVISFLF